MIKKLHDDVLEMEILPMEEPPTELIEAAEEKAKKPLLEDKDVFKEEIEEQETKAERTSEKNIRFEISDKPAKKGTGQRGPDKQKRAKPRVTQKRLDSLQRAREASVLRRQALAEEKKRLKAEINEKAKENLDKTVSFEQLKPETPPKPSDQENFFTLMDQWDDRKQEKKKAKRKAKQSETDKTVLSKPQTNQNHPASTTIADLARPKPPDNPFDELFNYTQKNTFW